MTKADLVKELERIYAAEDYFPGYLGNPHTLGAFVASLPKPKARGKRRTAIRRAAKPVPA